MGDLPRESYRDIDEIKALIDAVDEQYCRMLDARRGATNPARQTALNAAVAALDKLQLRAKGLQSTARTVTTRIEQDLKSLGVR